MTVMTRPEKTFRLEPVHPKPEEAHTMPYAPAIHIVGACDLMFVSGATSSPLYHKHPHVDEEHVQPHAIESDRTRDGIDQIHPRPCRSELARRGENYEISDRLS